MIIYQVGDCFAAVLLAEIKFAARVLLDVIMLDMRLRNFGVERECVETFCWWLANDKAAFLVVLLKQRLGTLAWHVTYVPTVEKNRKQLATSKFIVYVLLTRIFVGPTAPSLWRSCWGCSRCCHRHLSPSTNVLVSHQWLHTRRSTIWNENGHFWFAVKWFANLLPSPRTGLPSRSP